MRDSLTEALCAPASPLTKCIEAPIDPLNLIILRAERISDLRSPLSQRPPLPLGRRLEQIEQSPRPRRRQHLPRPGVSQRSFMQHVRYGDRLPKPAGGPQKPRQLSIQIVGNGRVRYHMARAELGKHRGPDPRQPPVLSGAERQVESAPLRIARKPPRRERSQQRQHRAHRLRGPEPRWINASPSQLPALLTLAQFRRRPCRAYSRAQRIVGDAHRSRRQRARLSRTRRPSANRTARPSASSSPIGTASGLSREMVRTTRIKAGGTGQKQHRTQQQQRDPRRRPEAAQKARKRPGHHTSRQCALCRPMTHARTRSAKSLPAAGLIFEVKPDPAV